MPELRMLNLDLYDTVFLATLIGAIIAAVLGAGTVALVLAAVSVLALALGVRNVLRRRRQRSVDARALRAQREAEAQRHVDEFRA